MGDQLHILVIVGSLRKGSYNRMLARVAVEEAPPDVAFELADIAAFPLFNEDVRQEQGEPEPVAELVAAMREADALLFVSPEYNHSIPGVVKNVIDWVSYGKDHPFAGKPTALMGTSTSRFGTVRMQAQMRLVLGGLGTLLLPKPEVMVSTARTKFDASGRLTDERSRRQVRELVQALVRWTKAASAR